MLNRINASERYRRRAVVATKVAVLLPVLVGFTGLSVDVGLVYNAKAELQRSADAAALAAMSVIAFAETDDDLIPAARDAAIEYTNRNTVLGDEVTLDSQSDVVFGHAYYDVVANSYDFVPGDVPTNAVRVTVRQGAGSPNDSTPLFFASAFGVKFSDISAAAAAIYVGKHIEYADCWDVVPAGKVMMCHYGDSDDSDDSASGASDDSDDSDTGDSDGSRQGDSDDSDDSEGGDSDDSDDSQGDDSDHYYEIDSESGNDSDEHTVIVNEDAVPLFLEKGDTLGPCPCIEGDSDDSDDSQGEFGPPDSSDSDDSDSGDSDGSENGDSDDSDDSQGEFGPPDSDDSDDSDSGDSDGSEDGDSDDSDDSQGEFGPPDSDDSDDSEAPPDSDDAEEEDGGPPAGGKVTICHIPGGNPSNAHLITIGAPAVAAHLAHGDVLGSCPGDRRIFLIE